MKIQKENTINIISTFGLQGAITISDKTNGSELERKEKSENFYTPEQYQEAFWEIYDEVGDLNKSTKSYFYTKMAVWLDVNYGKTLKELTILKGRNMVNIGKKI